MSRRIIRLGLLVACAILTEFVPVAWAISTEEGNDSQGGEYQVKAAFLFNFAKFVGWPAHKFSQPDSPLIIGLIGSDPFGGLLEEQVQDQRINDRTVMVRHVESMPELRKCHIIFICRSEVSRLGAILSEVRSDNVLTVGESDNFLGRGGMINFVMVGNAVHFQINDAAARRAGLKISSKLQPLALRSGR